MDGELYEKARDAYIKYAQIEVDSATLVRADMEDLREQAYLVSKKGGGRIELQTYFIPHVYLLCVSASSPSFPSPLPSSLLPTSHPPPHHSKLYR